jgi:hypothetical protein
MTTEELVRMVAELVSTNRDREALELTSEHLRELAPSMTSEQIVQVADFAHMAQMAVDLEAWNSVDMDDTPEGQLPAKTQAAAQSRPSRRA